MAIQKLNIPNKTDNAAKKKMVQSNTIGANETLMANEVNALVAKTNELVDATNNFNAITGFNFKENKATYTELASIVDPQKDDAYGVLADGLVYIYNGTSWPTEGNGLDLKLRPTGQVAEGVQEAVSGGEVYGNLAQLEGNLSEYANKVESIENSLDTIENSLVDGNFENGFEQWIPSNYSGLTITKEVDAMKVVYNSNNDFAFGRLDVLDAPISNRVYVSFEMRSNKSRTVEVGFGNGGVLRHMSSRSSLTIGTEWERYSVIPEPVTQNNQKHLTFKVLSNIVNDWVEIRKVVILDLSEIFGVSSEPSLEKIDSLVNVADGYWNGHLPQKYVNHYLLQNINGGESPSTDQNILLKNDLSNGDFSENISGVSSMQSYVSVSHVNNSLKIVISQDVEIAESLVSFDHLNAKSDDLYYFRIRYTSDFESRFYGLSGSFSNTLPIYVGENSFGYINNGTLYGSEYKQLRKFGSAKTIPSGSTLFINNILKINLTELFGKGNEPSVESFENLLEIVESDVYSDNIELPLLTYVSYNDTRIANKLATIETAFWSHLELHDKLTEELSFARVEPYLAPPSYYEGIFGSYPSLLKFYNGTPIQDADDWELRREEIKTKWHGIMGEWPELITDQELVITDTEILPDYIQHTVIFEWAPGYTTSGYLLVPFGDKVKPAVVTVYYDPETPIGGSEHDYRDFARQLARDGFVALSIGAGDGSNDFYYPSKSNPTVQPLSMMAYCAANAWHVLSKVENVDAERIGIVGQSYGGKWALFASCLFDKFAFGVWSDCGITIDDSNYFANHYLGTPTPSAPDGAFNRLKAEGLDFPEIESLMFPRPFLVSGGVEDKEDKWTVLNRLIEVYDFFGVENKVAMTNRSTHSHNAKSNAQVRYFFEHFLKLKK